MPKEIAPKRAPSIRDHAHRAALVHQVIASLSPGEILSYSSISQWTSPEGIKGRSLYENLKRFGFWSKEALEGLLQDHGFLETTVPFGKKVEQFIDGNRTVVGTLLAEFLGDLEKMGQAEFGPRDLVRWESSEGRSGATISTWVYTNGGFRESNIRSLLEEVDQAALLDDHPLDVKEKRDWTLKKVRALMKGFLGSLKREETWNISRFRRFSKDTLSAESWLRRHYGIITPKLIAKVLNDDSLLDRNPFEKPNEWTKKLIFIYLRQFIKDPSLPGAWGPKKVWNWQAPDGTNGQSVCQAMRRFYGDNSGRIDWESAIAEAALELSEHPFEYREINVWDDDRVDTLMGEFLRDHPVGQELAPKDLLAWIANDGTTGPQVHNHLCRSQSKPEGRIDWGQVLARQPDDLRSDHPFRPRELWTLEREQQYFDDFLHGLPENHSWSPTTLDNYHPPDEARGDAFHAHLTTKYRDPEGGVDWLYILVNVVPEKYWERNPFKPLKPWTLKREQQYFDDFLGRLPENHSWSPTTLHNYHPPDEARGDAFYKHLKIKYRDPEGGVDWLYILINVVPEKYRERNPFIYNGRDFWKERDATASASRGDVGIDSYGRGVIDESTQTAEEERIEREELEAYHAQRQKIRHALKSLDETERRLLTNYQKGEDVDMTLLSHIMQRLKQLI